MERRVIGTEQSSVVVSRRLVLNLHGSRVVVLMHQHHQHIVAVAQKRRDVGPSTHEGTFNAVGSLAVQVDIRLPVDTVEVQEHVLSAHILRHLEHASIPEVTVEERFRHLSDVVVVIWIRYGSHVDIRHQGSGRNRGSRPPRGVVVGR